MTIATIMKVIAKGYIYPYVEKMVFIATMANYKMEVVYSGPSIITASKTIGLAVKPSQIKVATQSVEL